MHGGWEWAKEPYRERVNGRDIEEKHGDR